MSDIMLDLETMGTKANAAIIAIGAVKFDMNGVVSEFYSKVSLESSRTNGGVIDSDTIIWWMSQSDEAKKVFKPENANSLNYALNEFSCWIEDHENVKIWGNGAAFDNVILRSAYENCQITQPWKFRNDRCYMTIKSMNPDIEIKRLGEHHNAVDDARSQALHLIEILKQTGMKL